MHRKQAEKLQKERKADLIIWFVILLILFLLFFLFFFILFLLLVLWRGRGRRGRGWLLLVILLILILVFDQGSRQNDHLDCRLQIIFADIVSPLQSKGTWITNQKVFPPILLKK